MIYLCKWHFLIFIVLIYKGSIFCTPLIQEGPIRVRVGVINFQDIIDTLGGDEKLTLDFEWPNFPKPLNYTMEILAAEDTINLSSPKGRLNEGDTSLWEGVFFEIDLTNQLNWISQNTGEWAIVLLTGTGSIFSGKITLYTDPTINKMAITKGAWTDDGNTAHFRLDGCAGFICETDVLWQKGSSYKLSDVPGPGLPTNINLYEGMVLAGSVNNYLKEQSKNVIIGQGYCAYLWVKDFSLLSGITTLGKFRAEYYDRWGEFTNIQKECF